MTKPKVVITDFDYGDLDVERPILEAAGARVVGLQAKSEADLFEEARDCDAIMNQYARVGAETIARMERCRVIARYGIGVDIVDVEAATRKGILVTNVSDYCTDEVADHAIALWLALTRKLFQYNAATHKGVWRWQTGRPIHRIQGRAMGVVSFGRIGRAIARRARAFGVELIAYDPYIADGVAESEGVRRVGKDEILVRSDYLMMQVPATPETHHFLGEKEFARVKEGVIIVNTGRGPTIDNGALYRALKAGRVAGAGLMTPRRSRQSARPGIPAQIPCSRSTM